MERWRKKIAVVTGASAGIGAAVAKDLAKAGMIVIGLARREGLVADLREELPDEAKPRLHTLKCDVTKEADVIKAFSRIEDKFGGIDVLVNNAGIVRPTTLLEENNTADMQAILNTNVMGVVYCTREAFKTMKNKNNDGHVVLINSVAGHGVPILPGRTFNLYAPSKHAITALTEVYRQEFLDNNTRIKITSISPGAVDTDILPEELKANLKDMPRLRPEDVSDAVMYVIQTPPGVQIHELTIKPVGETF